MLKISIVSTMLTMGCVSPMAPTNCLDPDLEMIHAHLEGVQPGDRDYALAKTWSDTCPEWELLKNTDE